MCNLEHEPTKKSLPDDLKNVLVEWKSAQEGEAGAVALHNLSRVLYFCNDQKIPLTLVVERFAVRGNRHSGGITPNTARRNGLRQDDGSYTFNIAGERGLLLNLTTEGFLVMRNWRKRRIGRFVPKEIVDLFPTPSEQSLAAS